MAALMAATYHCIENWPVSGSRRPTTLVQIPTATTTSIFGVHELNGTTLRKLTDVTGSWKFKMAAIV